MLLFKKLRLFADAIQVLSVKYSIGGYIYIREGRIIKIAAFPTLVD